jgi:hypothetical protein
MKWLKEASLLDIRNVPVYYISLPGDNTNRTAELLAEHGFKDVRMTPGVYERIKAVGVAKAHAIALETALRECDGPFIILEDDVDFSSTKMEILTPGDADAIYLGLSTWGLKDGHGVNNMISGRKFNGGLYKMYNMLAAHAVLHINHDYSRFLLKSIPVFLEMKTNQDKMRAETMKYWNVYALSNPIFHQKGKYQKYTDFRLSQLEMKPLIEFYR